MKYELRNYSDKLLEYIKLNCKNGEFPARSFYGELFFALALSIRDKKKNHDLINEITKFYKNKDKSNENFHWEFNNYALINLIKETENNDLKGIVFPLIFKGTKCTNWTILRGYSRILSNKNRIYGIFEIVLKIIFFQKASGLILDEKNVSSFQYHCFSMSLIGEAYEKTGLKIFKKSFLKAVDFIIQFILPNGQFNYVGRGQGQIFGFGPLIYSLEFAYLLTKDKRYKNFEHLAFNYLKAFQNLDGSTPLVLNNLEHGYPLKNSINDENFLGWYAYNNYFDYLPFLLYYLCKTDRIYKEVKVESKVGDVISNRINNVNLKDFIIYKNLNYFAVISKPGGYWTNDLPIPYIYHLNELLPCYGGEQFGSKLYSNKSIPLPWGVVIDRKYTLKEKTLILIKKILKKEFSNEYVFRDELEYKIIKNTIKGESNNIYHNRSFIFKETRIDIKDEILFKNKIKFETFYPVNLFFYNLIKINKTQFQSEKDGIKFLIEFAEDYDLFINENKFFCAFGSLYSIESCIKNILYKPNHKIIIYYSIVLLES